MSDGLIYSNYSEDGISDSNKPNFTSGHRIVDNSGLHTAHNIINGDITLDINQEYSIIIIYGNRTGVGSMGFGYTPYDSNNTTLLTRYG